MVATSGLGRLFREEALLGGVVHTIIIIGVGDVGGAVVVQCDMAVERRACLVFPRHADGREFAVFHQDGAAVI